MLRLRMTIRTGTGIVSYTYRIYTYRTESALPDCAVV